MAALEHNRSSGLRRLNRGRDYWHKIAAWLGEGWRVEGWSYTNTATLL